MSPDVQKILATVTLVAMLCGGGIGYGIMQERLANTTAKVEVLQKEVDTLKADTIRRREFEEVVREFKEVNKEVAAELKKILQRLPGKG